MSGAITDDYGWGSETDHGAADYLNPAICALVAKTGARDILDAGCGGGALCADLHARGYQVVGVDGDAKGIEIARTTHPGIRFEVARFEDSPGAIGGNDGGYDCVVSTEVVEHLYAPQELARFCFEALRPGGTLIITTPYHGYLKNLALSVINKWDFHHHPLWHGGHIKFWSPPTLGKLLTDAGFELTGFSGVGRIPYLWKSMVLTARRPTTA
ncbi:class I SAM-dependent methyltransferase [Sphingomonas sp. ZT3P38]|uniref:class I SAM-dependent methyltransferase n=1 Tax=Parasphingomonas zepuensis TaxID=3096161 RepID=UPI002FCA5D2E